MQSELTLPKVFGRYLLLRRISRGGMGEIFLAKLGQLTGFEKLCVIKKVIPDLAEDRDFIRRFIDEAQVAIQLSHANVAAVYEVGMVEGEYFLALEHVDGRDLRRILGRLSERGQRMPVDLALFVVREVASGLVYAHRRTDDAGRPLNLVHCDISPPNVIISFEGEVKIIDFGIAKSALRISATNPRIGFGKLGYMAPEQLLRGGVVDRRTDVYSTGVLLYEVLTGERLVAVDADADHRAIARRVAQGQHPTPSGRDPVLAPFDPIVARALAPDPAQRYGSAEELRDDVLVALAKLNPTLTADRLGSWLRDLFADEVAEEHDWRRKLSQTDLSDLADELDDARVRTVSYALQSGLVGLESAPDAGDPAAAAQDTIRGGAPSAPIGGAAIGDVLVGGAAVNATLRGPRTPSAPRPAVRPRWRWGLFAAAVAFSVGGLAAGVLVAHRHVASRAAAPPARPAAAPMITVPPPIVQQLELGDAGALWPDAAPLAVSAIDAGAVTASPATPPRVRVRPVRRMDAPGSAAVEAKLRTVSREYAAYKRAHGPELDAEWAGIVNYVTNGRDRSKPRRLDAQLDAQLDALHAKLAAAAGR